MRFGRKLAFAILFFCVNTAFAQLDPSSKVLLRSSGPTPDADDLDSSRYQLKPTSAKKPSPPSPTPGPAAAAAASVEPAPTPSALPSPIPSPSATPSPGPTSVTDRMQVYILGGDGETIQEYRKMLHPSDTRLNLVELSVAPGYSVLQSKSSYWSRNYNSSGPTVNVGANIWISPFFGIQASYLTSMNGQIKATPDGLRETTLQTNALSLGLRLRSFFGYSRRAGSLSYGIDYDNWQTKVARDATQRTGFDTSGLKLVMDANMPVTNSYSMTLGVELAPSLSHREANGATGAGDSNRTTMIAASIGGRYTFDRKNQIFWKITERLEQNAFQGTTKAADPVTSSTPTGVMVNQSLTLFQIGFTWAP